MNAQRQRVKLKREPLLLGFTSTAQPTCYSSAQTGDEGSVFVPFYCRQKLGLFDGLSGRVSDRREFSTTPSTKVNFWVKAISGALLFGSFILGKQNKRTPSGSVRSKKNKSSLDQVG